MSNVCELFIWLVFLLLGCLEEMLKVKSLILEGIGNVALVVLCRGICGIYLRRSRRFELFTAEASGKGGEAASLVTLNFNMLVDNL